MSPTVNELYDKLVKPKAIENAARSFFRQKALNETLAKKRTQVEIHDRCAKDGHVAIGPWTEHQSASGKVYQKCKICKQGFLVTNVTRPAATELSATHDLFPEVPTQRFVHHVAPSVSPHEEVPTLR